MQLLKILHLTWRNFYVGMEFGGAYCFVRCSFLRWVFSSTSIYCGGTLHLKGAESLKHFSMESQKTEVLSACVVTSGRSNWLKSNTEVQVSSVHAYTGDENGIISDCTLGQMCKKRWRVVLFYFCSKRLYSAPFVKNDPEIKSKSNVRI